MFLILSDLLDELDEEECAVNYGKHITHLAGTNFGRGRGKVKRGSKSKYKRINRYGIFESNHSLYQTHIHLTREQFHIILQDCRKYEDKIKEETNIT